MLTREHLLRIVSVIGGLAGGSLIAATALYLTEAWNNAQIISDVQVTATAEARKHSRWLEVRYHIDTVRHCPSWTQHTLYRDRGPIDNFRVVVPIGITVNGWGARKDERNFENRLVLPDDISPGEWTYVAVTSASCEWVPGLTRSRVTETPPVNVDVPSSGTSG